MAAASKLCTPCNEILTGKQRVYLLSREAYDYKVHHKSLSSFLEAAEQECFICSTILRCIDDQYKIAYLQDPTLPLSMSYRLYIDKRDERSLVRLGTRHYSSALSETQDIQFCLIPSKGIPSPLFI